MKVIKLVRFISQHKGKSGSVPQRAVVDPVQTDTVIEAQQTEHRQEEPHPQAYAAPQLERIIGLIIIPAVCSFKKGQTIDGAARVGCERVTQLDRIFIE